jgi:hypothetical protein
MADIIDLTTEEGQDLTNKIDSLSMLVQAVEDYLDNTVDARDLAHKCRDYYDGKQWSSEEISALKKRNQPIVTNNRIKSKVQFLMGMENQSRTDPKGLPRTPFDEAGGEVATDALRFVHEKQDADQKFTDGFRSMINESVEAHDVAIEWTGDKFEIKHDQLEFDRTFWDPHSRKKDFSDAKYKGLLEWMDFNEVLAIPGATEEAITFDQGDKHDTFDDKPSSFIDKKTKRVRVFLIYILINNIWHWAVFTKGQLIQGPEPSPYLDENGEPESALVLQSAFVDRENNRYPETASYLDLQDEVNHRASRALHLINQRQTFGNQGAVQDPQKVKREMAKADGHIEINQGEFGKDFGVIPTNDMAQGNLAMLQAAKDDIDGQGANAAVTGKDERTLLPGAFDRLQKGGIIEVGTLFDSHRYCKLRVWRKYLNRMKQYWTEERWVRVTDNDNAPKFIGINREVTFREKLEQQGVPIPPEMEGDPRLEQVVEIANPVGELNVDLILEESDDIGSIMGEQFDMLARLYEINPDAIPFTVVLQASSFRNKKQLIELMEGGTPEQQAAIAQQQEEERAENARLIREQSEALINKDNATADNLKAAAVEKEAKAAKTLVEIENTAADTEKKDAETDKIEVETASMIDEGIRPLLTG